MFMPAGCAGSFLKGNSPEFTESSVYKEFRTGRSKASEEILHNWLRALGHTVTGRLLLNRFV